MRQRLGSRPAFVQLPVGAEDTFSGAVDLLMSLQSAALALGDGLQAIDINPVILGEAGAIAVDALVVARQ